MEIMSTIAAVQSLIHTHAQLTGPQLEMAGAPLIQGLSQVLPKSNIPPQLVTEVAAALADGLNRYVIGVPKPA